MNRKEAEEIASELGYPNEEDLIEFILSQEKDFEWSEEEHYHDLDNCKKRSEFLIKALNFKMELEGWQQ